MSQVLIVSNRLPISVKKVAGKLEFYPSLGGLATGLSSYVKGSRNIWVGWPGIASNELNERDRIAITRELAKHNCHPVFLSQHQIDDYYNGYSNALLWPIFHSMPIKELDNQAHWLKAYRAVNKHFAEVVLSIARTDSSIWVHDYQLLLLPELLRAEHVEGSIGFFLHIPFPPYARFKRVEYAENLLIGMLGADLIGFHTTDYSNQFLKTCRRLGIGTIGDDQLILANRSVQVAKFPIGVDYKKYAQSNKLKAVKQAVKRYKRRYGNHRLIVAVDRLEPSKGLVERLRAYRDFLETNPEFRKKVIMAMVAAPSRMDLDSYQKLSEKLKKLSAEINTRYGTARWQPVDFINVALPFEEVTALYQLADVAFIAPLRDGMNLVAKEYVATKRDGGVLILSQTAGAAEELRDALLVDPKKPATVVEALKLSLTMPRHELLGRLKNMQEQIEGNTIQTWASGFVKTLQKPVPGTRPRVKSLGVKHVTKLVTDYKQSQKRLLLLDYDGSLVPFTEDYNDADPPKRVIELLKKLATDPANEVVVISGRRAANLNDWFGHLNISLVAEHGASIKRVGSHTWRTLENVNTEWKKAILPVLKKYASLTPRAEVEVKPHSLVWHYRGASPYYAQKYAVTIKHVLKPYLKNYGVALYQGNKILEIKNPHINKGEAIQPWLLIKHDFILAIGDDYTDEDTFLSVATSNAWAVKVGSGRTHANYRVKSTLEVIALLKKLSD